MKAKDHPQVKNNLEASATQPKGSMDEHRWREQTHRSDLFNFVTAQATENMFFLTSFVLFKATPYLLIR